jgi:hypothetical protein
MSPRAVTLAAALVGLWVPLLGGCGSSGSVTYVWVDVEAKPAVRGVTKLEVTVRQGGESLTKTFGDGVAPFTLPTDFTVTPNSHLGALTVEGVALGGDGTRVASGTVSVSVTAGAKPQTTLMLLPFDFQVNTTFAGAQIITDYGGRGGRQASASADGSLVVVLENVGTLSRYDGLGRLFDGDGAPRQNAVSLTKDDFVLNQSGTESIYYLAVAAAPPGGFLASWIDLAASPGVINARAFDASGAPSNETALCAVGSLEVDLGHVAAFRDGTYVAVWSQARSSTDSTHEIRGRLLDAIGQPHRNSTTGNNLDFPVGAFTAHSMERPTVAVGPDQSFVVAWLDLDPGSGGAVHAQRFSPEGQARGSQLVVATLLMAVPEAPNLAAAPDGYLVVYSDEATSSADTDVLVRYLGTDGLPTQPAYRVNTSTEGAQLEPAIAVADDGRTLVVWTDQQVRPEDADSGSIRGRALHPFGLPIGADFAVNTTTRKAQLLPSVAAAAHGAFLVAWQDDSAAGPDVDLAGVRGRMLYPDYALPDGAVGAACGANTTCGSELQCAVRSTGSFCHIGCSEANVNQPCPAYGGVCTAAAVAGTSGPVCLFR